MVLLQDHGACIMVIHDHLMGYFSASWSSSRWPLATLMSSRRQKLLARVNCCLQSPLKHISEWITGNTFYFRGCRYRQVSLYGCRMCGIFPSNNYKCKYTTARNRTTSKVASLFHLVQISPNRRQKATPVLCKIYYLHRLDIQRLYARVLHSEYTDRVFSLFSFFPPIDNEISYRTMLQVKWTLCHWILMNWYWTTRFHTRSNPGRSLTLASISIGLHELKRTPILQATFWNTVSSTKTVDFQIRFDWNMLHGV